MLVTYSAFVYSLLSKMRSTGSLTIPDRVGQGQAGRTPINLGGGCAPAPQPALGLQGIS